jgi:hypothetical protein
METRAQGTDISIYREILVIWIRIWGIFLYGICVRGTCMGLLFRGPDGYERESLGTGFLLFQLDNPLWDHLKRLLDTVERVSGVAMSLCGNSLNGNWREGSFLVTLGDM